MAGLTGEQKAEVEAMIAAALQRQVEDIGAKVKDIISQADAKCTELQADMQRSKQLHEVEMGSLASAEWRGNELMDWQNNMTHDCKALVESFEAKFTETDASTKDLDQRAATVIAAIDQVVAAARVGSPSRSVRDCPPRVGNARRALLCAPHRARIALSLAVRRHVVIRGRAGSRATPTAPRTRRPTTSSTTTIAATTAHRYTHVLQGGRCGGSCGSGPPTALTGRTCGGNGPACSRRSCGC